jgi:NAD(P)H dehydrogenase (quinone)
VAFQILLPRRLQPFVERPIKITSNLLVTILLILAHPSVGSFNHALAGEVERTLQNSGHEVLFHDLYAEAFPPLLRAEEIPREAHLDPCVARHCRELARAEGLVIVHPNWWGMPPAILVGWVDRVFRPGVAYRFVDGDQGEGVPVGLLRLQTAVVLNTSNTIEEREQRVFGDPLDLIWRRCVFDLCGTLRCVRRTFGVVVTSTPAQRHQWLRETSVIIEQAFPQKCNPPKS